MLKDLIDGFTSLVFPPHCCLCQCSHRSIAAEPLCPSCARLIQKNEPPFCVTCSRPISASASNRCRSCRRRTVAFDFAWSALLYNKALKDLVHLYKYYQRTHLRHYFGRIIIEFIEQHELDIRQFDAVTTIPLFGSKFRERGFNQSHLLARQVAAHFSLAYDPNLLCKARPTRNQADLGPKERWTNLEGAFKIRHPLYLKNKNILIIDDLLTTGATASQAAATLKKAGAKTVGVLTLAITP